MKIGNQITVPAGGVKEEVPADNQRRNASGKQPKTVYAGDVLRSSDLRGRVEHRKGMAGNQSAKIVRDAWNGDRKLDRELEQLDQYTAELRQTVREQLGTIQDVNAQKEELQKIYGISDEEMEIMARGAKVLIGEGELTEEEKAYYEITKRGWYPEYRQRISELTTAASEAWNAIGKARVKVLTYEKIAEAIHKERLKVHPMLDARKKAEEVMDAATEDIVGMVMDDTKEQIDKQQEEREEKAEEIKEEKEAREELLEERKEKDEELERLMEDIPLEQIVDGSPQVEMRQQLLDIQSRIEMEVQKQVLDIQERTNMAIEALKGSMVDIQL